MNKKLFKIVIILALAVFIVAWLMGRKKEAFTNYANPVCDSDLFANQVSITTQVGKILDLHPNQLKDNLYVTASSPRQWTLELATTDQNRLLVDDNQKDSPQYIGETRFYYSENCAVYIKSVPSNKEDPIFYLTYPTQITSLDHRPYASIMGPSSNQIWYVQKLSIALKMTKIMDNLYSISTSLTKPVYHLGVASDGVKLELHANASLSDAWTLTAMGTQKYSIPQLPAFASREGLDAYPGQSSTPPGTWMKEYNAIWNGKYIYSASLDTPSPNFLTITLNDPVNGIATGTARTPEDTWSLTAIVPNIIYGKNDTSELYLKLIPKEVMNKHPKQFKNTARNYIYAIKKEKSTGKQSTLCGKNTDNLSAICTQYFSGDNIIATLALNDMTPILRSHDVNVPSNVYNTIVDSKQPKLNPKIDLSDAMRKQFYDGQQGVSPISTPLATIQGLSTIDDCASQVLAHDKADRFLWNFGTGECQIGNMGSWTSVGPSGPSNTYYGSVRKQPRTKLLGQNASTFTSKGQMSLTGETVEGFKVGNINDCMDHCTNDFACTEIAYNYYSKECIPAYGGSVVTSGNTGDVVYTSTNTRVVPSPATSAKYALTSIGSSYNNNPKNILDTHVLSDAEKQHALDTCALRCTSDPNCDRWTLDASDQTNTTCYTMSMGQQSHPVTGGDVPSVFSGKKNSFMPVITKQDLTKQGRGLSGIDGRSNTQLLKIGDQVNNVATFNDCADQCVQTTTCHTSVYDGDNKTCQLYSISGDYNKAMDDLMKQQAGKAPVSTFLSDQHISSNTKKTLNINAVKEGFNDFTKVGVNNDIVGGKLLTTSSQSNIDLCRIQALQDGGDGFQYNTKTKVCTTYLGGQLKGPSKTEHTYSAQLGDDQKAKEFKTIANPSKYQCDYVCAKDWYTQMTDWSTGARAVTKQLDSKGAVFTSDQEGSDQCTCYHADGQFYQKRDDSIYDDMNNKWVATDGKDSCTNVCNKDTTGQLANVSSLVRHDTQGKDVLIPSLLWKGANAQEAKLGSRLGVDVDVSVAPTLGLSGSSPLYCKCAVDNTPFSSKPTTLNKALTFYRFFPKMDGIQSDLTSSTSTDVEKNKITCDQDPSCTGFVMTKVGTTFKNKNWIGRDRRQIFSTLSTENQSGSPTDGAYVKMYSREVYYSGVGFSNTATPNYIICGSPWVEFLNDNPNQLFTLRSKNRQYILIFQTDGNLCIYKMNNDYPQLKVPMIWCSNVAPLNSPAHLRFQEDGNVVILDAKKGAVWWSIPSSLPKGMSYTLTLGDDGILRQTKPDGTLYWSSLPPTIYDRIQSGEKIKVHIVNKATNAVLQSAQPGDCSTAWDKVNAHVPLDDPNANNMGMGWRFIKPSAPGNSPNDYFIVSDCNTFLQSPTQTSNCIDPYAFPSGGKADDYESIRIDQIDSTYCKLWSYNKQGYLTISDGCWVGINYDCYLSSAQDDRGDKQLWKLVPF